MLLTSGSSFEGDSDVDALSSVLDIFVGGAPKLRISTLEVEAYSSFFLSG